MNVVDQPALCSFIFPSIIERPPLIVAVSSGGASPVLARLLRARLESLIPAGYGRLAALAGAFRDRVKARFKPPERRRFWERVLQGPIAELVLSGRDGEARKALQEALDDAALPSAAARWPWSAPGRAIRICSPSVRCVSCSRPMSSCTTGSCRSRSSIWCGSRPSASTPARSARSMRCRRSDINHLLVRLAREGKRVVRLKGGDPFIFGRGGEEIETLAAEGIPFQVVPGITAAAGCASYAGIPLTHRDYSQSVVFVTGHLQDGTMNLNWAALAQPRQTIVFYMGLLGVDVLCRELAAHGLPATTPAALVQQGTTPQQRVLTGNLDTLPDIVRRSDVKAPTLIIIGEVVRLRDRLNWFK